MGWGLVPDADARGGYRNGWLQGVEFYVVNTDAQALENSQAENKVQVGVEMTRGLGASVATTLESNVLFTELTSSRQLHP